MSLSSIVGTSWVRKTLLGALVSVIIGLGAYAFTSLDGRYVHMDTYQLDRLRDSLRQVERADRFTLRDSILGAKMDEALLRLQQIQCGDKIVRGCR